MSLTTQFTVRPPSSAKATAVLDAGSATAPAVYTAEGSGMYRATDGALGLSVTGTPRVLASAGNVAVLANTMSTANVLTATHAVHIGGERKVDGMPAVQPTWRNLGSYADPPTPALQLTLSNVNTYQNMVTTWGPMRQPALATRPTFVDKDPTDGKPAIAFDRTNRQHMRQDSATLRCQTNGGMTLVALFKFSGTASSYESLFWVSTGALDRVNVSRSVASNAIICTLRNGSTELATITVGTVEQNQWNLVAFRFRQVAGTWTLEAYRNGVKTGQTTATSALTDRTVSSVYVGRELDSNSQYNFNGNMRYLGVWDRPLSDAELAKVTEAARIFPDLQGVAPICRFLQGARDSCLVEPASDMILPGPGGFPGGDSLAGATLLPDGRIFCTPYSGTTARLVDPRTNTVSTPNLTVTAGAPFQGSVLLPNGKIFLLPRVSTYGLTYDPVTDTATTSAVAFDGTVMSGGVLLPSGQVFVTPYNATYALLYDYLSDSLSTPSASFPGGGAFLSATPMADGRVFCVPWNSTTARIFNPVTSEISTPSGTHPGSAAFSSAILLPDGRLFIVPYNSTTARIYDAQTDSVSTPSGTYPGNGAYRSGVLTPCGRVAMIPYNAAANVVVWDPDTDTLTTARGTIDTPVRSYWGGVVVPDGRVFMTPTNKTQAMFLHAGGWGLSQLPNNVVLSPWLNNKI